MPITKDHLTAAGVALAVGLGVVSLVRTVGSSAPPPIASASAPLLPHSAPVAPSKCKQACESLASWCAAGRASDCESLLTRYEREGHVSCADGISAAELASIGWCADGGEEKPMVWGKP